MRWAIVAGLTTAGCGWAASGPDAATASCECFPVFGCKDGKVIEGGYGELSCPFVFAGGCERAVYTCSAGCTVEMESEVSGPGVASPALCAETPPAQVGDPCSLGSCLPTRAQVAAEGTVTQQYLACDVGTSACVVAAAPVVDHYLDPCPASAALVPPGPTVNGMIGAYSDGFDDRHVCLLAWDAATSTVVSGVSIQCYGDWDCPDGAMCDDHVPQALASSLPTPWAVCRPGARGTPLDPARL